jgi:hypothetical protein
MHNVRFTGLLALCAALAACDQSPPTSDLTAPQHRPSLNVAAAAEAGLVPFVDANALAIDDAAVQQAATGGRASGHFAGGDPTLGIADEKYSFTALSTEPKTLAAKGEVETHATTTAGTSFKTHATVTCLSIVGNRGWIGAVTTKVWINNQVVEFPGLTQLWKVVDNGEGGKAPADAGSLMRFGNPGDDQLNCEARPAWEEIPTAEGNIQVRP